MFLVASIRECWIIAVKNKDYLKKLIFRYIAVKVFLIQHKLNQLII